MPCPCRGFFELTNDLLGGNSQARLQCLQQPRELVKLSGIERRETALYPGVMGKHDTLANVASRLGEHNTRVAAITRFALHTFCPGESFESVDYWRDIAAVTDEQGGQICHRAPFWFAKMNERPKMGNGERVVIRDAR